MKYGNPFICVVCSMLILSACSSPQPDSSAATVLKVWPPAPAPPRVAYVRSIATPRDLGIKKSLFRRFMDKFSGGSEPQFVRPSGVAERNGVLYVADPGAQSLWILDPAENHFTGVHQTGDTELLSPVAVAVRADGAVYVADSVLGKVLLLDSKGNLLRVAAQTGLRRPVGLVYNDQNAQLYVADSAGQRIVVYRSDGEALFSWGKRGNGDGEFNYPTHLALGPDGEVLVTDALNFRVQAFDQDGQFLWQFGRHGDSSGSFAAPKGVAIDGSGNVYVVDALFDNVQLFAVDGTYLMSFGERGNGAGQFWLPGGLFVGSGGRIFVADAYNRRIQEFSFLNPAQPSKGQKQP